MSELHAASPQEHGQLNASLIPGSPRNVPGEPTQSTPRTPVVEAAGSEYAVRRQETSPPALQQAADALRLTVD